jgi:D-inositol-3-phosphate glycosyltransferase
MWKKKKICRLKIISIGPASPLRGGIAKFNESFALACKAQGFEIEIFSFSFLYPGFLFPGKSQYTDDPPPKDVPIYACLHSLNPLNWFFSARKIIQLKPEIVVLHYWMPFFAPVLGFIARRVRSDTSAKVIAVTHNLIPHEKQAFSGMLTNFFVNSIDGLVCLSSSVLGDLRTFNKSVRAIYLPHPVYDIYGSKGLDLLLKAFVRIDMPDLILLVAGEFYEHKSSYFDLVDDLGISERVIFTDSFIPDSEVKYYFSAADMVVQPYLTATQSGVTQIAYQFDCPMLVTNTGGLAEIVSDNKTGFVCGQDTEEIAKKITLFYSEDLAAAMIENIKKEKHKFSWESFVKQLVKLAESV